MLKLVARTGALILTSAIAIPYAVALILNLTHGWPIEEKKFRRAFHPRKVYSLNMAIIKQLGKLRYLPLYLKWKKLYASADSNRIFKDILYGEGECRLDVYRPSPLPSPSGLLPVVVFVYGGTWSSGDKDMYPLLCTQLADSLQAVVCCPNYSLYPKGYVDDMVRDIVDTLKWIHSDVQYFGGDKERIMLIGHSAGAHLIAMATLELAMKQLLEDPASMVTSVDDDVTPSMSVSRQASGIHFDDVYFNSSNGAQQLASATKTNRELSQLTPSEEVEVNRLQVSGKGSLKLESSGGSSYLFVGSDQQRPDFDRNPSSDSSSFFMLDSSGGSKLGGSGGGAGGTLGKVDEVLRMDSDNGAPLQFETMDDGGDGVDSMVTEGRGGGGDPEEGEESDDDKTVEGVCLEEGEEMTQQEVIDAVPSRGDGRTVLEQEVVETLPAGESQVSLGFEIFDEEDVMTTSQREARSMLSSIRVVVGLAGVYHIADHYKFEYGRGVEDISTMARTMYGKPNFERFSPTAIVNSLPKGTRVPAFHLVHGSHDGTVPTESSTKFCAALSHMGARHVTMTEIPQCGHLEICLDLMDADRTYYTSVMSQILASYHKYMT